MYLLVIKILPKTRNRMQSISLIKCICTHKQTQSAVKLKSLHAHPQQCSQGREKGRCMDGKEKLNMKLFMRDITMC